MALHVSSADTNADALRSVTSRVSLRSLNLQIMVVSGSTSLQRPTALQRIEHGIKDCMLCDLQALSMCLMCLYKNTALLCE